MPETEVTFNVFLNTDSFSWKLEYFNILHDALVEAFNEVVKETEDVNIDSKDTESIQWHTHESGITDRILNLTKRNVNKHNLE